MSTSNGDEQRGAGSGRELSPEFHRRVLDNVPAPILVVQVDGTVVYANQALYELGDWELPAQGHLDIARFVHDADAARHVRAFRELAESPSARVLRPDLQHAEAVLRLRTRSGEEILVEILGRGGVYDEDIGGIICHVRPLAGRQTVGEILRGLSEGESLHQLLSRICRLIEFPPLDLGTVILRSDETSASSEQGAAVQLGATNNAQLSEIVHAEGDRAPWFGRCAEPTWIGLETLSAGTRDRLRSVGAQELCWVSVESPLTPTSLRIISATRRHPFPLSRPTLRVRFAADMAAACLLRTRSDVLLDHAAASDPVTGFPNGPAFRRNAEALDSSGTRACVHLAVDGLDEVRRRYGAATADGALVVIADRLRALTTSTDLLGRMKENELIAVVSGETDPDQVRSRSISFARNAEAAASEPVVVAGRSIQLSASVGVACASADIGTDQLLTWADAALSDAKRAGGARIQRYGVAFG